MRTGSILALLQPFWCLDQEGQLLERTTAYGSHHAAVDLELVEELGRNPLRCSGQDDGVERRLIGPSLIAVADADLNVGEPEGLEARSRFLAALGADLDGVDLTGELGEDGSVVAGAGADLEHLLTAVELQQLDHQRRHVGLEQRVAIGAQRHRLVDVGLGPHALRDEQVPRNGFHGIEQLGLTDPPPPELLIDHVAARLLERILRAKGDVLECYCGREAGQ